MSNSDAGQDRGTIRPALGSLAWGYVGLPLARAFALKGFPVLGFDIDAAKGGESCRPARATSATSRRRRSHEMAGPSTSRRTARFERPGRARRHHYLRADAAHRRPASRDLTFIVNSAKAIAARAAAGPTGGAGEHDLSRDDAGPSCSQSWEAGRTQGRPRFSSSRSAPSARTPATATSRRRPSPRSSAASTRRRATWPRRCTAKVVVKVVDGFPARKWPRASKILENTYAPINIAPGQRAEGAL